MQIHYALFDQATDMGGGNYWTWADKELPHELLTRFYNNFAAKHLAPEPNRLGNELWGGIVHLAAKSMEQCGWLVLYREFDGGHDRQNRPNRFVILTAWIRTNEVYENLVPVFNNETFQYISAHSKELPVPPPTELSENTGETIMRSAFEKFVPFVNPCWDSHLQVENKPTGMDTTESDAFTQELGERLKAERLEKKHIREELNKKLQWAEELLRTKELEWKNTKEKLNSILNEKSAIIKDKDVEIKDLRRRTIDSPWGLLAGGAILGVILSFVLAIVLFSTGDMKFGGGWFGKSFQKILPSRQIEKVVVD
ncbi:MAG: hypothetical protein LBC02_12550 [Planctomycetaceae bacterium]|jgi:hypothetical protein|nr:hypothetical protein [Planctomycetaceae bacterium]